MKFLLPCYLFFLFIFPLQLFSQDIDQPSILYGNIFGEVKDENHNSPIEGVTVLLFHADDALHLVRQTQTDNFGKFLFSGIETEWLGSAFSVQFRHPDYQPVYYESVLVRPGAPSSLALTPKLSKNHEIRYTDADFFKPLYYYSESIPYHQQRKNESSLTTDSSKTQFTVFATREGLVGFTTANGHKITERDKFVALPSRRGLNPNDQQDYYSVKVTHNGKSSTIPVWDVGPWNTRDDYWNPPSVRENWSDLPTGTPQSQAAFLNGYNGGKDQFNRIVKNPAGIDLADGVFWDDLTLSDNGYVLVDYLWRLKAANGDTVKALTDANVRQDPAGAVIGKTAINQFGIIVDGFVGASIGSTFYIWWKIKWSDSLTGWSAEPFLRTTSSVGNENPSSIKPQITIFPNPASTMATIRYVIPESGFVTLSIYNINGQLLQTIVSKYQTPQMYELNFHTNKLASGLYFITLNIAESAISNKLTIIK